MKDPDAKLGDEHIIPQSLGGTLILPEASCQKCEGVTTQFEEHCAKRMFGAGRFHLGIKGRRQKGPKKTISATVNLGPTLGSIKIPIGDHPGVLVSFTFPPPSMLMGMPHTEVVAGKIVISHILPDFTERLKKRRDTKFVLGHYINAGEF